MVRFPGGKELPIGVLVMLIDTFLFINAGFILPESSAFLKEFILLYLVVTAGFLAVLTKLPQSIQKPAGPALVNFGVSFFLWAFFFQSIPIFANPTIFGYPLQLAGIAIGAALVWVVVISFVVAYTEELVFRAVLPTFAPEIVVAIMFGLFHVFAYQGNFLSLIFAMVFGFILQKLNNRFGLMAAVGAHAAWNLGILGAF